MKKAKYLLLPVAAFALTATSVGAFNSDTLRRAGLTNDQVTAFEQARDLKQKGDRDAARDVLAEAGIDLDTLEEVRNAVRSEREEHRAEVKEAISDNDYAAFQAAVADREGPLAEHITSGEDFERLVEAHQLRLDGEHAAAREIMKDLGLDRDDRPGKHRAGGHTPRA